MKEKIRLFSMKRLSLLFAAIVLISMTATAQNKVGEFSLKPMVGINVSDITTNEDVTYKSKVGFTGGLEAEYGVTPWLGVSLGAFYSQQGGKYEAQIYDRYIAWGEELSYGNNMRGKLKTDYVNLPLICHFYICKGLSIVSGVQIGFLVNDKFTIKLSNIPSSATGFEVITTWIDKSLSNLRMEYDWEFTGDGDFVTQKTDLCKSIDFGIPVGLSYEYKNITLDARYYFGLTNMNDLEDTEVIHNRCLSITLGYRFRL